MRLYQKTPFRNVLLGTALQIFIFILVFCLEKFVLQNTLFRFCEAHLNYFGNSTFEQLMLLPSHFIGYWFLLYWLNRYVNEHCFAIGVFDLKNSLCFAMILTLLDFHCCFVKEILPTFFGTYYSSVWLPVATTYQCLIRVLVGPFVFYKGLGIETQKSILNYRQFLKKGFSFLIKKAGWFLALLGAAIAVFIVSSVILFFIFDLGNDQWSAADKFGIRYIGGSVLQIITFIVPMLLAKLQTSFAEFFTDTETASVIP